MAELDHSNTILIVKPVGPDAEAALRAKHNADRLMSFHFDDSVSSIAEVDDFRNRECTPYVSRPPETELHLKYEPKPKDVTQGFVFGSDEEKCDVQLLENPDPKGKRYGISRQHFRIDFNWTSGFLRLNNMSHNGTGMRAPSVKNGYQLLRHNNMHMLHPAEETKVCVGKLIFEISFPARGKHQRAYEKNWEAFLRRHANDVPSIKTLDIQSTLEITRFLVRREGRHNTYFLHDEIGKGEFGMVCKASEHRTGELFAAKQFATRKPGWDAKAYMEIAISQKVTHEHIVSFVDSIDDGGRPVLVMEYMPLGNLTELHKVQRISLEEMRTVLHQGLQALAYLHDQKNITHRDIKPENILVRTRTPLFIKLCDFGLSTQSSSLKTHCGTKLYAAAEIFTGFYTNSVDIWAIGVLGYQFIRGLPKYSENLDPKHWSEMIRRTVDRADCQGGDPAVQTLKKMLELKPLDRPSARDCLLDPWIRSAPPLLQPGSEQGDVRPGSLETISEQSTEIWNPPTQMLEEMRNQTVPKESLKRLRSSESITLRRQPSKKGPKKVEFDKSLERNVKGLLAEGKYGPDNESPKCAPCTSHIRYDPNTTPEFPGKGLARVQITAGQTGQKLIQRRARSPFKQVPPANEDRPKVIAKVTDFDARHVQIKVDNQVVLMRKEDCFLNATQTITLANKNDSERKYLLGLMKEKTKVEVYPPMVGIPYSCSWVNFQHGRILCKHLELEQTLQPLMDYGRWFQRDDHNKTAEQVHDYLTEKLSQFFAISVLPQPVFIQRSDFRINASHILRAASRPRTDMVKIKQKYTAFNIISGSKYHQGTYVDFQIGVDLCREYGLTKLEEELKTLWTSNCVSQEPGIEAEPLVMVSRADFRVNASDSLALAGRSRREMEMKSASVWPVESGLSQTFNHLPESPGHASGSPQVVGTELDRSQTSARGSVADRSIQAEHIYDSDSISDAAASEANVKPREPFSTPNVQSQAQDTPSIRFKNDTSSRQSGDDIKSFLLEGIYPQSPSARSSQYSIWDSEPRYSLLDEVKLGLEPQYWKTASPYESFIDTS